MSKQQVETLEERRAREGAERIRELEEQRRWHVAESQDAQATISHHQRNIDDINEQIARLRNG